jgi:hypothetical protein
MFSITVRDEDNEWTEEYQSKGSIEKRHGVLVNDQVTAELAGKSIVKRFNDTLRPHDSPREFVSAKYLGEDTV